MLRGWRRGFLIGLIPGPRRFSPPLPLMPGKKDFQTSGEFGKEPSKVWRALNQPTTAPRPEPWYLSWPWSSFAPATAMLLGALIIHGVQPGPSSWTQQPEIFGGSWPAMYIGNFVLLIPQPSHGGRLCQHSSLAPAPSHGLILLLCLVGNLQRQ